MNPIQDEAEVLHRERGLSLADAVEHIEAQRAALAGLIALAEDQARLFVDFEDPAAASEPFSLAHLVEVNADPDTATLLEWAEKLAALEVGEEVALEWWPIRRVR